MSRRYSYNFSPGANPKKGRLGEFGTFDIETNKWCDHSQTELQPMLLCYYDKYHEDGVFFDNPDPEWLVQDFLKWYVSCKAGSEHDRRSPFICYAHNAGRFDFPFLFRAFTEEPYFVKNEIAPGKTDPAKLMPRILEVNGSILDFRFYGGKNGKSLFRLRDSLFLLPQGLDRLTSKKGFDVKHKKWDEKKKQAILKKRYKGNEEEWREYCLQDCIGLYEVLDAFKKEIEGLGGVVYNTIAKTALLGVFQNKYLKHKIPSYFHYNNVIHKLYRGGRTEVFQMYAPPEEGKVYNYYDYNSLYPSVMHDNLFPTDRPKSYGDIDEDDIKNNCCFARATITIPEDVHIPSIPIKYDERLMFPVGVVTDFFDGVIINEAYKQNYDVKIHRGWMFRDSDYIFKDFVSDLYNKRLKSGVSMSQTLKLILNSTYGKFGQKSRVKTLCTRDQLPKNLRDGEWSLKYPDIGLCEYEKDYLAPFMLPAIASRVTAYGQMKILHAMQDVVKKGGIVYYCDTDSVLTDVRLRSGKALGELKLECTFEAGVFLSPKMYTLYNILEDGKKKNDIIKMKGYDLLPEDRKRIGYDTFEKALLSRNYKELSYNRYKPRPLKTLLRWAERDGEFRIITGVDKKSVKTEYSKRKVNYDDFTTKPFIMKDGKLV